MPRLVVPILRAARLGRLRDGASSSRWSDRISGTFSAILRFSRRHLDALAAELLDLVDEVIGVEHHAVADDRQLARPHDARRQQRELEHLAVDHERVAGVVAALEAHDDVGRDRQPIDDLAFAFVAPLGADHDDIGHRRSPSMRLQKA